MTGSVAPSGEFWSRRSVVTAAVLGLAGCNTTLDSASTPTPDPTDAHTPTSTPTGPLELTFTVRGCEGAEIRIAENSSARPLYSGVDSVSLTLERGENYHVRVEYEYEEYAVGTFKAVGEAGERELYLERCES